MFLVVLTCVAPRFRRPVLPTFPADFNVYYSAALLVRQGHAAELYTGADTGADPQKLIASPDSPIFHAAQSQGLAFVGLYVYPPILADLLLPLTFVNLSTATHIWFALNCLFLVLTAALAIRLLKLPFVSGGAALILVAVLCFTPALQCLVDGQITIFLLLLWTAGLLLYEEDYVVASAAVFALATAVKLTPALALVPVLIWRKWRFTGAFAGTLLGLALLSLWADTAHAFVTYFTRVLPAMSGAVPFVTNYSLPAAVQRVITLVHTGSIAPFPPAQPSAIILAGRAASMIVLVALVALIARGSRTTSKQGQVLVIGLLGLMAPILSPVSWFHAYATAFIAFVLLWRECLQRPVGTLYLVGLTVVSLLLGSAVSENLMATFLRPGQPAALATCLQLAQLLAAAAVVLYRVAQLREQDPPRRSTQQQLEDTLLPTAL